MPITKESSTIVLGSCSLETAIRIVSAAPLSGVEREKLESAWRKKYGGEPSFVYAVDPSLIGGIRIEDGDAVYDASIKGQLSKLRKQL